MKYCNMDGLREIIILSEVSQTKRDKYHMISLTCRISKNNTNGLIYKTETDTQTWKTNLGYQREKGMRDKLGVWD